MIYMQFLAYLEHTTSLCECEQHLDAPLHLALQGYFQEEEKTSREERKLIQALQHLMSLAEVTLQETRPQKQHTHARTLQ